MCECINIICMQCREYASLNLVCRYTILTRNGHQKILSILMLEFKVLSLKMLMCSFILIKPDKLRGNPHLMVDYLELFTVYGKYKPQTICIYHQIFKTISCNL